MVNITELNTMLLSSITSALIILAFAIILLAVIELKLSS